MPASPAGRRARGMRLADGTRGSLMTFSSYASTAMTPPWRRVAQPPARLLVSGVLLLVAGLVMSEPRLDVPAFLWLQHVTGVVPPAFWSAWSVLGLGVCAALIAALASDERMGPITVMLWSLLIGGLGLQLFKHIWVLPRPAAVLAPDSVHIIGLRLHAGSMPSGHAAML